MKTRAIKREEAKAEILSREPLEVDPRPDINGVLLSDEIEFYTRNFQMISPFDKNNLKPAAYELTIGDEYFLSGQFIELSTEGNSDKIVIPPFEVAVLKTTEILRLPRFLIARWNIRVTHAYSGLLWVGGPQVDPGYTGYLYCPIYNLSDREVSLRMGDPIAVIDFVKTTPFNAGLSQKYKFPPKRLFLEEYNIDDLKSALFTRAGSRLSEMGDQLKSLEARFITFTQICFALIAVLVALTAILSRSTSEAVLSSASILGAALVTIVVWALLVSILYAVRGRVNELTLKQYGHLVNGNARSAVRFVRRWWWGGLVACSTIALLGGWLVYGALEPIFQGINSSVASAAEIVRFRIDVEERLADMAGRLDDMESSVVREDGNQ